MGAPLARFLAEFSEERPDDKVGEANVDYMEAGDLEPEPEPVQSEPVMTLTVASIANALREAREMAAAEERARLEAAPGGAK